MTVWQARLAFAGALWLLGCSSNSDDGAKDTSSNTTSTGGSGGTDASGAGGTTSTGGAAGSPAEFENVGVCGLRSQGTVTTDSYDAYEEYYLLGDEGFGEDLCVVRFDVKRVGEGPAGCDQFAGQKEECQWTHLVEYGNPEVVLDIDGACANSELGLDSEAIAGLDGKRMAYGYVFEYQGHNSVIMTYDEETSVWTPLVNAGWSEESGALQFDRRDGFCGY